MHLKNNRFLRLVLIYLATVVLAVSAITIVYSLPQKHLIKNIKLSIPQLEAEGQFPRPFFNTQKYRLANFMDAIMLHVLIKDDGTSSLKAGFLAPLAKGGALQQIDRLKSRVNGSTDCWSYARFWHGYSVFLRPLTILFPYQVTRLLNLWLLSALLALTVFMLSKVIAPEASIAFLVSLFFVGIYIVPLSLTYSTDFYLSLLAVNIALILSLKTGINLYDIELMFVIGMLTSFFSTLVVPLLTLGLPLVTLLLLLWKKQTIPNPKEQLVLIIRTSGAWAAGYAGFWITKWVLALPILGRNIFSEVFKQILMRAGLDSSTSYVAAGILNNIGMLIPFENIYSAEIRIAVGLVIIISLFSLWASLFILSGRPYTRLKAIWPFLIVALIPYAWMLFASQHSAIHAHFTYRIQAITIFSIFAAMICSVDMAVLKTKIRFTFT